MPNKFDGPKQFNAPNKKTADKISNAKGHKVVESGSLRRGDNSPFPPSGGRNYPNTSTGPGTNYRLAQVAGASGGNIAMAPPAFFSPLHTPQNWQIASKRREALQWCRFFYENEPIVAAAIDFYSIFPLNGFTLECKDPKIKRFYEHYLKKIDFEHWLKIISHEYHIAGEVFPFLEIQRKNPENLLGGKLTGITVLNPDFIEVGDSPFPNQRPIHLIADEELKKVVYTREPRETFDRLPDAVKAAVSAGMPIPLSKTSVSHIKHAESPYGKYGTSILRRLFTILAYKTKLMTANWIIAERLILPVRLVKVGSDDRPAGPDDIADVQAQFTAVASDPNVTIVTHHNVDYDWIGSTGKFHNIQQEWEMIRKELLDGLMLNAAILNGEAAGYNSAQIGVEVLLRRLEGWRSKLAHWAEEHVFKLIAIMEDFVDEEATEELGVKQYLYPTLKWNDLQLRDKTPRLQMLMMLNDKSKISDELVLEEFGINYDQEVERVRAQQMAQPPSPEGPMGGMGDAMGGGMGMAGLPPDMGGGPPPDMGAPPDMGGGEMPPDVGGGETPMASSMKVEKRGKGKKEAEQEPQPPTFIKLTKPEQRLMKIIQSTLPGTQLYGQFEFQVPGKQQPFVLDFAVPRMKLGFEADGPFHREAGQAQKDKQRDQLLAQHGWTIVRFSDEAISHYANEVQQSIKSVFESFRNRSKKESSFSNEKIGITVRYANEQ